MRTGARWSRPTWAPSTTRQRPARPSGWPRWRSWTDDGRALRHDPSAPKRLLDGPDRQRSKVDRRPVIPVAIVGLGRAEPQAALVGDGRHAAGRLPALVEQPAPDHERGQRVRGPDPDLGALLARAVDRAIRARAIDGAHPATGKPAHVPRVDRPQRGLHAI